MKLYRHEIRQTPWTRWHIFYTELWMLSFVLMFVHLMYGLEAVFFNGDSMAVFRLGLAIAHIAATIAVVKPLRECCYFQEIWDDINFNIEDCYASKKHNQDDQFANVLMQNIEAVDITPADRQSYRMELKAVIQSGHLSLSMIDEIRNRHGYLM